MTENKGADEDTEQLELSSTDNENENLLTMKMKTGTTDRIRDPQRKRTRHGFLDIRKTNLA